MPEGHVIHNQARRLSRLFKGTKVRVDSPQGRFAADARKLNGREIDKVEAHGKHLFIGFDDLWVQKEPACPELAGKLQVAPGVLLTSVRRVIVVDKVPVAYMLDVAPVSILSPADVDETFRGSVLDLLRQKQDLQVAQAIADIVALDADAFLAEKLGIELGEAVLLLEETLFNQVGEVVEFSRNYFVPDFFRFHVVRR